MSERKIKKTFFYREGGAIRIASGRGDEGKFLMSLKPICGSIVQRKGELTLGTVLLQVAHRCGKKKKSVIERGCGAHDIYRRGTPRCCFR